MNTIKLYLQAGLGNQLFMIFATMSYAIDNGFNYVIYSYVNYVLDGKKSYWNNLFDNLKFKITDKLDNNIPLYEEKNFEFVKIPSLNIDFNIKGYFQSYKYFEHNYKQIMQTLKIYDKINDVKNKYNHYFKKKTIALHFRMGDTLIQDSRNGEELLLKPSYYDNALSYLETIIDKNEIKNDYDILYFAENISSDKSMINDYIEIINKNRNYNFIKVSDDIEDYEQLLLMSLCDHFIIASSTFSWFSAYFNQNKDKKVIYPTQWFGAKAKKETNTSDLCPKDWIEISRT
jgi:hypothetical protein